jgi:hypothetical protein
MAGLAEAIGLEIVDFTFVTKNYISLCYCIAFAELWDFSEYLKKKTTFAGIIQKFSFKSTKANA